MPPQVNATLTGVTGATAATGGRDDWDAPGAPVAGEGAVKWSGEAAAYYRESRVRAPDGLVELRELIIDTDVARAADVDADDVLTFTDPAGNVVHARARTVAIHELPGIPNSLQTTRLELELAGT